MRSKTNELLMHASPGIGPEFFFFFFLAYRPKKMEQNRGKLHFSNKEQLYQSFGYVGDCCGGLMEMVYG